MALPNERFSDWSERMLLASIAIFETTEQWVIYSSWKFSLDDCPPPVRVLLYMWIFTKLYNVKLVEINQFNFGVISSGCLKIQL